MQRLPCTAAKVSKTLLYLLHKGWLRKFYLAHIFSMHSLVSDFPANSACAPCYLFSRSSYLLWLLTMTMQYPTLQNGQNSSKPTLTVCLIQKTPRTILNNNFQGKHAPQLLLTTSICFYFQGVLTRYPLTQPSLFTF